MAVCEYPSEPRAKKSEASSNERKTEPAGEAAADGRLARAHQADKHDWAVEAVAKAVYGLGQQLLACTRFTEYKDGSGGTGHLPYLP